jgi:hypothetical protein
MPTPNSTEDFAVPRLWYGKVQAEHTPTLCQEASLERIVEVSFKQEDEAGPLEQPLCAPSAKAPTAQALCQDTCRGHEAHKVPSHAAESHSPFLVFLVYNIPLPDRLPMRQALDARLGHAHHILPFDNTTLRCRWTTYKKLFV